MASVFIMYYKAMTYILQFYDEWLKVLPVLSFIVG